MHNASEDAPVTAAPSPLHFADARDLEEFVLGLGRFERGEMTPDEWRVFRLNRGTYGQRQPDVHMLRIKIPQGIVDGPQLRAIADVADIHSRGFGHLTTRQNIQLHFVELAVVPDAMARLAAVGLTTKEACGNTIRNITGCALAGVCGGAPFDVTPYAQATSRYFLRTSMAQGLPRKFKIAFSGCQDDCAQGAINDVGLLAEVRRDGDREIRGFRVRVAGGLSTSPENAHLLHDFVPADEILGVIEAVVRVFDRTGNRQNRSRARLKYVVRRLGWEGFVTEYERELAAVRAEGRDRVVIDGEAPTIPVSALVRKPAQPVAATSDAAGVLDDSGAPSALEAWRKTSVRPQQQAGYSAVIVRLPIGDVTSAQLRSLADLAERFGDGTARATNDQNFILRFVPKAEVNGLYAGLVDAGLGLAGARTLVDTLACPGADTCNLAVTHSRELAGSISERLEASAVLERPGLASARGLDVKISGCPNSCGQHHVAAIGFHGTIRRIGGRALPEYQLHLGGGIDAEHGATFGRQVLKLPARRIADAVVRLLDLYEAEALPGEPALAYFRRVEESVIKARFADVVQLDETTALPEDFIDLGQSEGFVVAIGEGECAT